MATSRSTTKAVERVQAKLPRNRRELFDLLEGASAPEEIVAKATEIKDLVLMHFGLKASATASLLFAKCYYQVPSTALPTMAVILMADGTAALTYNPYFTVALGEAGAKFVLFHESRHLMYRHLHADRALRSDPQFTLACEVGINHDTLRRFGGSMPTVTVLDKDGQPVLDAKGNPKVQPSGVDPKKVYDSYVKDLKEQNLTPVTYDQFVRTDFVCYTELKRMAKPLSMQSTMTVCVHSDDGEDDGTGEDSGAPQMDGDTAGELVEEVLRSMMTAAMKGNEAARQELLDLAARTEDSSEKTKKLWGDLGLGRLRGQTLATRRVDWWKQWLNDVMASRLVEGERLIYNKKRGVLDLMLGNDPILSRRGNQEEKLALVAIDTSGSIPEHVLEYLTKLVGHTDGVEFRWVAFDGTVVPFVAGEAVVGGGGTSFKVVQDYAEGRLAVGGKTLDVHPDVVLMVTDGVATPIRPQEPDKWVWLITEGGDTDWLAAQAEPMDFHRITTGDGV